ncbi:MAG TPA: hypothetical protein VK472_00390 [Allosphingosinicella sp.]|nr:hypothetical protein [Allosphingosinicella sp.]
MNFGQSGFAMQQGGALTGGPMLGPITAPHMAVDDFLPIALAEQMRQGIDDHFAEPHKHTPETHQSWNYWYVPDLYTYLRTQPEKIMARPLVERFHAALQKWARETLGMGRVTWPYLSLYIDGCQQNLHNDSTNGRFGYVYSLTWDDRKTIGGETIVLREGDLFRANLTSSAAGFGLYDLIQPRFNRLAMFDDRMPHGVQRVEGSMDPLEGRFVLHGHISEGGPLVDGPLPLDAVSQALTLALAEPASALSQGDPAYHGPLVLRIMVEPSGEVRSVRLLLDRVARVDGGPTAEGIEHILAAVGSIRFPAAPVESRIHAPLIVGSALPPRG